MVSEAYAVLGMDVDVGVKIDVSDELRVVAGGIVANEIVELFGSIVVV